MGIMENPCPPAPLLLASRVLMGRLNNMEPEEYVHYYSARSRMMSHDYVFKFGHFKFFSSDLSCGSPVKLVHASGRGKDSQWWRTLCAIWGGPAFSLVAASPVFHQ